MIFYYYLCTAFVRAPLVGMPFAGRRVMVN